MRSPKQELWFVERTEIRGMHSACTKHNLWNPHLYLKECYLINAMCGRTCTTRTAQNLQKSITGQRTLMMHYQFYITSLVPQLLTCKPEQPYSTRPFLNE